MLAILLGILLSFLGMGKTPDAQMFTVHLPAESTLADMSEEEEWAEFHRESFSEHAREFDMLFNSYETKRAKNGAMMIRRPGEKSFKFARKA